MPQCAACAHEHAADARFCGHCGAALSRRCQACAATLQAGQLFCTSCGAAARPQASQAAGPPEPSAEPGERRHATIVFSDLSGYTALNERLDPEDLGELMADLRDTATRTVQAHGGIVNQVVGDEIMALYGIPQAGRDDAVRALRATLQLHARMQALAERHASRLGQRVDLHSGINSGLVVVRPCAPHQGQHGLTGDAVNTAARLLKLAGAGEIVVGDATWRMVASRFEGERLAEAVVRGKAAPVRPWRLRREVELPPAAPLLGRDDELQQARSALRSGLGGAGARWVVVRGEPGIGKTRLLGELAAAAAGLGADTVIAAVPDFGPARGNAACRSLVAGLLRLPADADLAALQAASDAQGLAPALQPHVCALLERPLGAADQATYAALDGAARERGALDAVVALLGARCAGSGLLLALEDLHWAEPAALALLARAAAACRAQKLVWAVSTRPQSEAFDAARRAHAAGLPALTLDLGPLAEADAQQLARHLAGPDELLVQRCVARAQGNPLFLEQLLRASGEALRDALPGSIQSLVLARLDCLEPADKAALQAASVIGQRVDLQAWAALVDAPRLEPLVEAGLLRPDVDAVHFVHALIRDSAYASLLKARRRELHRRAADWYGARQPGLRAEHLALAQSPLAAAAFADAARLELQRFRHADALALAEQGLACVADEAQRHGLALLQGEALRELGRNQEAQAAFAQARACAATAIERGRASHELASVHRLLAQVEPAWKALDEAAAVAEQQGDEAWLSRIHYLRGNLCFARGDSAACAEQHARALALARSSGDPLAEAQALSGLGDAHYAAGRMRSALQAFEQCVASCRRAGALRFAVMNQAMVGWCCYWHGRAQDCRQQLQAAGEAAAALSHRNAEAMVTESLGLMLSWMGDDEAGPTLEHAIVLSQQAGMRRFELASRIGLAGARRRAGSRDEALALARQAWQQCTEIGAEAFAGPLALIEIARNSESRDEVEALLQQAQALLARGAVAHNTLFGLPEMMQLRLAQQQHDEVLRLADALEHYVSDEPLLWATHHARVARALVRQARGPQDAALRAEFHGLLQQARACQLMESARTLERALASAS